MLFLPLDRGASQSRSCLARSGETRARASWWTSCPPRSTYARAARAATTPGTPSSFRWAPKTQRRRSRSISFRAVRARSLLSLLLLSLSHSCGRAHDDARSRSHQPQVHGPHRLGRRGARPVFLRRARSVAVTGYVWVPFSPRSSNDWTADRRPRSRRAFVRFPAGLDCTDRLFISDRAHLVFDFHQIVDGLKEVELGGSRCASPSPPALAPTHAPLRRLYSSPNGTPWLTRVSAASGRRRRASARRTLPRPRGRVCACTTCSTTTRLRTSSARLSRVGTSATGTLSTTPRARSSGTRCVRRLPHLVVGWMLTWSLGAGARGAAAAVRGGQRRVRARGARGGEAGAGGGRQRADAGPRLWDVPVRDVLVDDDRRGVHGAGDPAEADRQGDRGGQGVHDAGRRGAVPNRTTERACFFVVGGLCGCKLCACG